MEEENKPFKRKYVEVSFIQWLKCIVWNLRFSCQWLGCVD
jgi:hypothetical protein